MASPVAELEAGLNYMQSLKPPGVSGTRIQALTTLCVDNVQSESVLIQKIYTHFKKAPGTHKLGVLYVVDSVTRRWVEQAKQHGQQINSSAPDGTYAAGVHRVTELIPVLMNDIIQNSSEQKEKIKKLVDIWEKGQTFPAPMIESFKQKLSASLPQQESTTPAGSPPPGPGLPGLSDIKPPAAEAPNAILEALTNLARQNPAAVPPSNPTPPANQYALPPAHIFPPVQSQAQAPGPFSAAPPPMNVPGMPYQFPQLGQAPPVMPSSLPPSLAGLTPSVPPPAIGGLDPNLQQQVMLIKLLAEQGVALDKIPAIVAAMQNNPGSAPGVLPPSAVSAPPHPGQLPYAGSWGQDGFRPPDSRDRFEQARSPNRYRNRSRSRSPGRQWESHGSHEYGAYGRNSPGSGRGEDRRGKSDYRQRSPAGRRGRSPTPEQSHPPAVKWFEYDRTLPQGHIKVLSRTLFVGGVTCSESELRNNFSRQGQVQTCIVNKDKRHAFVKMVTRREAVAAKEAMDSGPFRTRWGVGFGPRDCSDYQTGISIIPISRLTEADRKWMLSAEYGGSGGRPIDTGLVVEEPDIEIGAGVSSKAISRRMQTDKSGRHGPKSTRPGAGDDEGDGPKWRRNRDGRREERGPEERIMAGPIGQVPSIPDFPFGIGTGPNGMPIFPPGFSFPAPPGQ